VRRYVGFRPQSVAVRWCAAVGRGGERKAPKNHVENCDETLKIFETSFLTRNFEKITQNSTNNQQNSSKTPRSVARLARWAWPRSILCAIASDATSSYLSSDTNHDKQLHPHTHRQDSLPGSIKSSSNVSRVRCSSLVSFSCVPHSEISLYEAVNRDN
jgi:hypothetical protein